MKKIFSFVVVAFAAIALNAKEAVFDFTNPASLGIAIPAAGDGTQLKGSSYTVDVITVDFPSTVTGNGFKEWNSNNVFDLRVYQPNSFTISSKGDNISKIQFVFGDKGGLIAESGEIDGTGAWNGNAASVTFTNPEKAKVSKIKSITVYTGEAPVVKIDTLNVAEMNALIDAAPGKKLSKQACVIGRVGGLYTAGITTYGNVNVWLADIRTANATDTIEAYGMLSFNGARYNDAEDVQFGIGDTIVVYSASWEYYNDGKNAQYEASKGCTLAKVIGEGHPEPIVIEEISVEEAIAIAEALSPAEKETKSTPVKYDVRGYVVSISEKSGLDKIYLADDPEAYGDFQAYKCEILDGATVNEGDFISVVGYISNYNGGSFNSLEVANGKITVLSGTALPTVKDIKNDGKYFINGTLYIKKGDKLVNVLGL